MTTVNWNSGVSGKWATGSDWSTGSPPGASDIVSIGVGGTYTVTVAAAASAYSLAISNQTASLDLAANLSLTGGLADSQSLIDIAAGTLAVTGGAVTFGVNTNATGASVDGPGTLSTAAGVTTTIDDGNNPYYNGVYASLILGGGVTWSNSGTVADTGHIQIGDGSGETAKIVNNAGGVFQFEAPYAQIYDNSNATGSFSNAGTIEVGTNTYFAPLLTDTSTGVIDLQSGTLDLQANSTIGGTVTGTGTLEFGAGLSKLTAATSGNVLVGGGVLTLATTTAISGALTDDGGTIDIASNVSLTGVLLDQAGLISLAGDKLSGKGATIDSGATLSGYGTMSGAVIDSGVVLATGGALVLGANSQGSGTFEIAAGNSLEFLGAATAPNLSFLDGGSETLLLATPKTVQATITGFGAQDSIDLLKTAATGLSYANGTLTVTGSTGTLAKLDFSGSFVQANFGLKSDLNGGENIVFQTSNTASPAPAIPDFAAPALAHLPAQPAMAMEHTSASAGIAAPSHMHVADPFFTSAFAELLHHGLLA